MTSAWHVLETGDRPVLTFDLILELEDARGLAAVRGKKLHLGKCAFILE